MDSSPSNLSVGIVGASGYSGEVLVNLLERHPYAKLHTLTSRSLKGKSLGEAIPALRSRASDLYFSDSNPSELAASPVETFFLALPHGVSSEFAVPLVEAGKRVIDLSADFRLSSPSTYHQYYGSTHPAPHLLLQAPYVLADWEPLENYQDAPLIACPGCYPTSILIPLLPLLRDQLISGQNIVASSMSSVSGAGKKVAATNLFCERNESVRPYGFPNHRHLSEIEEQLSKVARSPITIQFLPHLVPINRGIISTIILPADPSLTLESIYDSWEKTYRDRPFVSILPPGSYPDTLAVAGTNRIDLAAFLDPRTSSLILASAEDNLVKGASGQAVQIFNLLHHLPETAGLI